MSNSPSGITQKYARFILNSTNSVHELQVVLSELQLIRDVLSGFTELFDYLSSQFVSAKEKLTTWRKISLPVSNFTVTTLDLMINNHRLNILTEVIEQLEIEFYSMQKSIKVQIKTASVLDDTTKSKIKSYLQDVFSLDVIPYFIVNPSVIGGFIAYGDSIMLDLSYKKRIDQLKREFKVT